MPMNFNVLETEFLVSYKKEMMEHIKSIYPDISKKDAEKVLDKMILDRITNPSVLLDNNYTGEQRETSLLSVFNWALDNKDSAIIAGNATFYKNQYLAENPIAAMLDNFLITRKKYKKQMFKAGEELGTGSDEYKDLDRRQSNEKINANS